jgi:hypothetical protein
MLNREMRNILQAVAGFYDQRKVGDVGFLGFRRSTDLTRLVACLDRLIDQEILIPGKSLFLDMGCADGRVNVLLSYLVKVSVGIELNEWIMDEYLGLRTNLEAYLQEDNLCLAPDNIFLFQGNSMDDTVHESITMDTGVRFDEFDLFYTYLTMQEEFAGLIARKAKKGSVFMVYGLGKILPQFDGLRLLTKRPLEGILALYQKE